MGVGQAEDCGLLAGSSSSLSESDITTGGFFRTLWTPLGPGAEREPEDHGEGVNVSERDEDRGEREKEREKYRERTKQRRVRKKGQRRKDSEKGQRATE